MKRYSLKRQVSVLLFSIITLSLLSQTFDEPPIGITLPGVTSSSVAWGDYNNDGYLDILLTGYSTGDISKIYRNKDDYTFEESGITLPGVSDGSAAWGDYDNDGDLDILLTGYCSDYGIISKIYRNNYPVNTFTDQANINLTGVRNGSVDWGDYDNDGYLDILLTGSSYDGYVSKIYRNNSNNTFTEQKNISLTGVGDGSVAWGDYDNDGYLDILLTGTENGSASGALSLIYHNNGDNTFTEQTNINLTGVRGSSISWGDYDNDGDLDILLTGSSSSGDITKIYRNDGSNTFTYQTTIIPGVSSSSVAWGDFDNDGYLDILLTGNNGSTGISKIYHNNGNNSFSEQSTVTLESIRSGSVAWGDYNKDGNLDIFLTGTNNNYDKVSKIYRNLCGTPHTTLATPTGLSATSNATSLILQWAEVPGNSYNVRIGTSPGASDVVSPMFCTSCTPGSRLKPGMGNAQENNFFILRYPKKTTYYWSVQAIDNGFASSEFAGEQLITFSSSVQASQVWADSIQGSSLDLHWRRGNGSTACVVFAKEGNSGTVSLSNGASYPADNQFGTPGSLVGDGWYCVYDGTGNSVNITGLKRLTNYIFQVIEYDAGFIYYTQTGQANPATVQTSLFTELTGMNLPGFSRGSAAWGDYDNDTDHDLDILLAGYNTPGGPPLIYENTGSSTFVQSGINNLAGGSGTWGDYDNDGDLDILFTGSDISRIFRNDGANTFTLQSGISLIGVDKGSEAWSDFDNDGDLDIILAGKSSGSGVITKIYRNDGSNTFTEQPGINLPGISEGAIACSDYNNDGYIDILLTGNNISKIYRNNGNFTFTEQTGISLPGLQYSSAAWGDYDNDGNLDILLTGSTGSDRISKIYRNNGNNSFTEQNQISLPGIQTGSVACGDYDNDGDLDILITGEISGGIISKIYRNDSPANTFSEQTGINLKGVKYSSVAWGDYDRDGDLDILLTGEKSGYANSNLKITKIYQNDLNSLKVRPSAPVKLSPLYSIENVVLSWNPVIPVETPAERLSYNIRVGTNPGGSEIITAMASGSGIRNISSMGNCQLNTFYILKSLLPGNYYWSVQAVDHRFIGGEFSLEGGPFTIESIQASKLEAKILTNSNSSLTLKWENGNGQRRVVFCKQGSAGNANPVDSKTYTADPIFGYGDQIGTSGWYSIYNGRVDSTTIYGLTPGVAYSFHVIEYTGSTGSEVYYRTTGDANPGIFSSGLFSEQSISLYNVDNSSVAWGDYNNDGYLDILLTGNRLSTIFRNNGNNTFTDIDPGNISLEKDVDYSSASWGDYDNDGNLDILLSGYYDGGVGSVITRIFHNDYPLNSFTEQTGITLPGVRNGSAAWGDYDNDGFLDILLSGQPDPYSNGRLSVLYHNNGGNSFTEQTGTDLIQVNSSSSAWGDYDNDGYLDFLLTGHLSDGSYTGPVSKIYHNNGDKTFTEQSGISLIGVYDGSVAWGDYDNDGDLDILITGQANSGFISSIYLNNGDNTFTEQTDIHLTGMSNGSAAWGDYNNDGYLDILLTGGYNDNGTFYYVANIYRNNGNNTFTEQTGISLIGVTASSAVWGDYDNDGDLDILLTGTTQGGFGGALSKIYRNNTIMKAGDYAANLKPAAPGNILASPQPDGIKLSWAAVKTDETPFKTMTYNIRVGTTQFGFNTYTAHADATSGYRRIVAMGNTQLDNTFLIKNLPSGNYFWSVQAVDQGFMGGTWSAVNSFEVKNVQTFYSTDIVCLGFPTNFTDQSDAIDGIASWKWDFKDGTTSSLQNPDHTFATSGTYNVKLVITSNGGVKDSLEKNIFVKPRPITGFNASTTCQGTPTTITNTTDNNSLTISSWYWDFGDGLTSTVQQPDPHGYLGAGSYPVLLKALANNGCIDSISETIIVGSYPVAAVTANAPLTFCKGDSVTLSVPYNINYLYNWKVAGASITGADSSKYVAKLTGNYTVEVINSKGNCKTISSQVNVTTQNTPSIPLISTIGSLEFCQGDSAILSVANTSGYIYHWKLNGGAVGSNSDSFTAKVAGIYNLEVSNIVGCSVFSSNSVNITVNPLPSVNAVSLSGPTQFCQGGSITLSVPSNSAYSYNWRNEDGLISDANTNRYMAISSGKYQLDISNPSGCVVSTLPINVVVKTMPLKPLITSDNYQPGICLGENPIRLNISQTVPGYNYQWYKNGIPLSYATSSYLEGFLSQGDYALEADLGGCKSQSDILNVYFQDAPEKPSIYAQGPTIWYLACSNDSATQYKWYFNGNLIPGADKYLYIANQKLGEYNVSIANTKGCYTMSDTLTVPTGATGIEEVDPFEGLKIYPNPTTGMFTIEMDNPVFGELMISILDQGGKEILNIKFEKTTEHFSSQIDLSGQAKGMYLINLLLDKYLENRKIIVE